jgi:hypothetical protein
MESQIASAFLSRVIDWKEFELFVADLYRESDELTVDHNVTETGKSGAKRQIDVRVVQRTKLHTIKILVECKFWKSKVDRPVIDSLFAAIEDLNANKGVIFTTVGYEEGALLYAKSKNIDIFIIRDVKEDEWGKPGRNIFMYLQFFNGRVENLNVKLKAVITEKPIKPESVNIKWDIIIQKDPIYKEEYQLYSFPELKKGPNMAKLIKDVTQEVHNLFFNSFNQLYHPPEKDHEAAYRRNVIMNFDNYPFRFIIHDDLYIEIEKMSFEFLMHVSQTKFQSDRAASADFVLVVENYLTNQKHFVSKAKEEDRVKLSEPFEEKDEKEDDSDVLQNGSIAKISLEQYVAFSLKPTTIVVQIPQDLTVNLVANAEAK